MLGPLSCDHLACFMKFSTFFEAQYTPHQKKKARTWIHHWSWPVPPAHPVHPHAAGFSFCVSEATFPAMPAPSSGSKSRSPTIQTRNELLEQSLGWDSRVISLQVRTRL